MKSYSSREVIKMLTDNGWYCVGQEGIHRHYKHPTKTGKATIPHPKKHIPIRTLQNIARQTGLEL
ncbi:MAG: type II toxin-antitoxin system HicA family toxin [Defluviitaleaceae bacterium]|nr:type II toxin-antitoxin system HicA family toxin [Defluviitaleaceae bacterium]